MPTTASASSDTRRTMDALRRIVHALRATAAESEREGGLTAAQLFLLRQIAATPGCSVGELAARARTGQSFASEVVARLVSDDLVERRISESDRRRAELVVTNKGKRIAAGATATAQERLLDGLSQLSASRRRLLAVSLERWIDASGFEAEPATLFFEHDEQGDKPTTRRR